MMSLGFGIGDFIAVLELANRIRKEFVGAPSQFKAICDEVRSLSIVLQDIDIYLSGYHLDDKQKIHLQAIGCNCQNVFEELQGIVRKYQQLENKGGSLSERAKRVWKRVNWEPEDIRELRDRITSNVTLLNTFLGGISSQTRFEIKRSVDRLNRRQDDQERLAILEWLTPIDYTSQQSDFINRREVGTGEWLLNSVEFQTWVKTDKRTLFCPGIPGAGKTILTSIVIQHLQNQFQHEEVLNGGSKEDGDQNNSSVGIGYLYCNFRRQDEQKVEDLLASLLKQLAQGRPSLPDCVKSLYDMRKNMQTRLSFDEISKSLQAVIALYSKVFLVVDALDECQGTLGSRTTFLMEIFNLQAKCGVNIFATSRLIPEITEKFAGSISLEIRASEADVRRYVDGRIAHLPSFVARRADLQEEIKTQIVNAVDGMFLLAQLHLECLIGKRSPKAVRDALARLPTGSEAYDYAYKDAMKRIEGQVTDQEELAKQVLSWITCAKRPLTTIELQHALAVEVGESDLDEENLPQVEDIVSVCAGLVTVDKESGIIRLVHYTTQVYFERTQNVWFPDAEFNIMTTCIAYLSFSVFESGTCETKEDLEERMQSNPLYDYAARNWGYHSGDASKLDRDSISNLMITKFLKSGPKVEASSQPIQLAYRENFLIPNYIEPFPSYMMGLHVAAYFGLETALHALFDDGYKLDLKDVNGWTPLCWAAAMGQDVIVEFLLATGRVDIDSKEMEYGRTPLLLAAANGHLAVVRLLIENGAELESRDNIFNSTPLLSAAWRGREEVVELLLKSAIGRHFDVVKLLLGSNRVDPNCKDHDDRTPLSYAAESGHETIVKLLLAKDGIDLNSKDALGRTALWYAVRNGHEAVVNLLLAKDGIDMDPPIRHLVCSPSPPGNQHDFEIAIICTSYREFEAVEALLDQRWVFNRHMYSTETADTNTYSIDVLGRHSVVVVLMGRMGKVSAASGAASCRSKFRGIKLVLVVGICGAVTFGKNHEEILPGNVIVSHEIIPYSSGRSLPDQLARKDTLLDSLRWPTMETRALLTKLESPLGQKIFRDKMSEYLSSLSMEHWEAVTYPGVAEDRGNAQLPVVHFGPIASGSMAIKWGEDRDKFAAKKV